MRGRDSRGPLDGRGVNSAMPGGMMMGNNMNNGMMNGMHPAMFAQYGPSNLADTHTPQGEWVRTHVWRNGALVELSQHEANSG